MNSLVCNSTVLPNKGGARQQLCVTVEPFPFKKKKKNGTPPHTVLPFTSLLSVNCWENGELDDEL